jgi:hypothetical protein
MSKLRTEEGGDSLLIRQMMDAVGKFYAVHEIVWQPIPAGVDKGMGTKESDPNNSSVENSSVQSSGDMFLRK